MNESRGNRKCICICAVFLPRAPWEASSVLQLRHWQEYLLLQWFCPVSLPFLDWVLINELCDDLFLNRFNVLRNDWSIAQVAWDGFQNRLHAARWGAETHRLCVCSFRILYVGDQHHRAAFGNKHNKGLTWFLLTHLHSPSWWEIWPNASKSNGKWHKATRWNTSVRLKTSVLRSHSGLQTVPSSSAVRPAAVNVNEQKQNRAECN